MKKTILSITAMLTLATSAFAEIGSLSADLVFTPVTPCRIVDTRNAGGTIAANTARGFKAWSATGFAAQGGSATPCGIPQNTNVAALELNLVAVLPAGAGYITAYPSNVAQPTASTLNYVAGDIVANGAAVKVSQASLATDWTVYTFATTHFVADVTGYYSMPVATALQCIDVAGTAVSVAANADAFINAPTCTAGYTSVGFIVSTTANGLLKMDGTRFFTYVRNSTAGALSVTPINICCRIPGR